MIGYYGDIECFRYKTEKHYVYLYNLSIQQQHSYLTSINIDKNDGFGKQQCLLKNDMVYTVYKCSSLNEYLPYCFPKIEEIMNTK